MTRFTRMSPGIERQKKERIVEALAGEASESEAAWMASTTVMTLCRWREEDQLFDQACSLAADTGEIADEFTPGRWEANR